MATTTLRQRVKASLGNRLGSPLQQLSTFQVASKERVQLHFLEQLMHVECDVVIVESHNESQCDLFRPERIHEASAERVRRQRPPQSMNHPVERARGPPYLLHAQCIQLWIGRTDLLPFTVCLRQQTASSLRNHGDLARQIGRRRVVSAGLAIPVQARRSGTHAAHGIAFDQQGVHRKAGEKIDAEPLGTLTQPSHHLTDRGREIVLVVHRRRCRDSLSPAAGQQIHGLGADGLAKGKVADVDVRE
jgi:hypothetical protein